MKYLFLNKKNFTDICSAKRWVSKYNPFPTYYGMSGLFF